MKVNVKHIVEIAGGLIVGSLLHDAVNVVIEATKKQVEKHQNKEA
jgi:hypothetical protein